MIIKVIKFTKNLFHLKIKEIILIKNGLEHIVAQDKEKMLYRWGNNSCRQCGFEPNKTTNGNIFFGKNIS